MYNVTLAVKCYQLGLTRQEAVALGAYGPEFDMLAGKYQGRSLTTPELYGFKPGKRG